MHGLMFTLEHNLNVIVEIIHRVLTGATPSTMFIALNLQS